jgi:ligand-binding sensor domain-containing protein
MVIFVIIISFTSKYFSQNNSFEQVYLKKGLNQSQVNKVYSDSRSFLWLATAGEWLSIFDGASFINYTENEGLISNINTGIVEDKNEILWAKSDKNIARLDERILKSYTD